MKRLLLVEDDQNLGQTLTERLSVEGFFVRWAENLNEARGWIDREEFHLVILDVGLPDGTGFHFARELKKIKPYPFIFVTAQNSASSRLQGYELGAEEFIPKPFLLKELLIRIHHVLRDHGSLRRLRLGSVVIDFDGMNVQQLREGHQENLSLKEMAVLKVLVERSPAVVSRDELIDRVWGQEKFPTQRTVDNVILRLRQSLGDEGATWIRSVRGVGYQWQVDGVEESNQEEKNG